ncbi:MAG: ACP S-malonyltransferase [Anaerolineae bacterium]
MTTSIAWLFPGQGAQAVGMGRALAEQYAAARAVFETADSILGASLSTLCFEGPKDTLDDTYNSQPALLTTSVAVLRALEEAGGGSVPQPSFCAGHSLGEYSALVAAGALEFEDALRLVRERGRLMKKAGEQSPGGMAALIGVDDATAQRLAEAVDGVQVANYNSPGQVVLSGRGEGIAQLAEVGKSFGVRKVMPLAVTIAAHSSLMASIVDEYRAAVEATPMRETRVPVISNVRALPLDSVAEIRAELVEQLTASVRWTASIQYLSEHGVDSFVELGPGNVLTGLVKRIVKDSNARAIGTPDDINNYLAEVRG